MRDQNTSSYSFYILVDLSPAQQIQSLATVFHRLKTIISEPTVSQQPKSNYMPDEKVFPLAPSMQLFWKIFINLQIMSESSKKLLMKSFSNFRFLQAIWSNQISVRDKHTCLVCLCDACSGGRWLHQSYL